MISQHLVDARRDLGCRPLGDLEAEGDVLGHRHVGEERVGLEDHADIALVRPQARDIASVDADLAGGRLLEARHHAQGRGLAAARGPEEGDELPALDRDVEMLHPGLGAEDFPQVLDLEEFHGGSDRWRVPPARPGRPRPKSWISPMQPQVTMKATMARAEGS